VAQGTLSEPQEPTSAGQTALEFPDNRLMIELCGEFDKNLNWISLARMRPQPKRKVFLATFMNDWKTVNRLNLPI